METYSLICEGRCNPSITAADDLVVGLSRLTVPPLSTPHTPLFTLQRSLRYTPHTIVRSGWNREVAVCTECRNARQYGGNPWRP